MMQSCKIHCIECNSSLSKELSESNTNVSLCRNTRKETLYEISRIIKGYSKQLVEASQTGVCITNIKITGLLIKIYSFLYTYSSVDKGMYVLKHAEYLLCALKIRVIGVITRHLKDIFKNIYFK